MWAIALRLGRTHVGWHNLADALENVMMMVEQEPPMIQQAGRINDARGRKVAQLDPIAIYLLRQHNIIDADVLRAITHEKGVRITRGDPRG